MTDKTKLLFNAYLKLSVTERQEFDKQVSDFPWYVHAIPFLYFVLYTFLLRQMVLDLTKSRNNKNKKRIVEYSYITVSLAVYLIL